MKFNPFFCTAFAAMIALSIVSCGKDEPSDPAGTVTLNMLDEGNGKTILGKSDVYINNADNFISTSCLLVDLGPKSGLGAAGAPVLTGTASQMAVEPGHAYQVFGKDLLRRFPSGNYAMSTDDTYYYNVYVVSTTEKDGKVTGAAVKYVEVDTPGYGLPEYNKNIGTLDHYMYPDGFELRLTLPVSDFEFEEDFASSRYYELECEKSGRKLIIKLKDFTSSDVFGLYIRIGGSYTRVYGRVQ